MCPFCGGVRRIWMGDLGWLRHYRCQDCGIESHELITKEVEGSDYEEEEQDV